MACLISHGKHVGQLVPNFSEDHKNNVQGLHLDKWPGWIPHNFIWQAPKQKTCAPQVAVLLLIPQYVAA